MPADGCSLKTGFFRSSAHARSGGGWDPQGLVVGHARGNGMVERAIGCTAGWIDDLTIFVATACAHAIRIVGCNFLDNDRYVPRP